MYPAFVPIFTSWEISTDEFYIDSLDLYERFDTEQETYDFLNKLLDKFKNLYEMYSFIYKKFDFIKPKGDHRIEAWNTVRDVLEDDSSSSFETFLDKYKNFL